MLMRVRATFPRLIAARFLVALLLATLLAGCRGGTGDEDRASRLVLVVDPTVLRDMKPADFDRRVGAKLRAALAELPEDSFVDLYFVGRGQAGLPVDYRAELPFNEDEANEEPHLLRAKAVADSVVKLVHARWAASNEQPNRPSSCILTALYRAQEMTKFGSERDEDVTVVVVSDFLEACSDTGYNFEREIPDSVGALPVEADLSGADRVLMLRMQTSGAVALRDEPRLIRVWSDVLKRWRVNDGAAVFTPNIPDSFVEAD